MTGKTMDPEIRKWLYRKGFTEQHHIDALEELGHLLVHSCILLLHVLPRCSAKHRGTAGEWNQKEQNTNEEHDN